MRLKKLTLALATVLTFSANANFVGPNEFSTVKAAKDARDDTWVAIEGKILNQIKEDEYLFTDGKETIEIEIDDDVWLGQKADAKTAIRIHGEVDKEFMSKKIDVKRIEVLNNPAFQGGGFNTGAK